MPAPRLAAVLANRKITGDKGGKRSADDKRPSIDKKQDKASSGKRSLGGKRVDKGRGLAIDPPPRSPKGDKGSGKTPGARRKRAGAKTPGTPNRARASARLSAQAQSAKGVSRTQARTSQYLEPPVLQSLPVSARRGNRNRQARKGLFEGGRYRTKTRSFSLPFTPLPAGRLALMKRYMLCQRVARNKTKRRWLAAQPSVLQADSSDKTPGDHNNGAEVTRGSNNEKRKFENIDKSLTVPTPGGLLAALAELSKKRSLKNTDTATGVGWAAGITHYGVDGANSAMDMEAVQQRKRRKKGEENVKKNIEEAEAKERGATKKQKAEKEAEAAKMKAEEEAEETKRRAGKEEEARRRAKEEAEESRKAEEKERVEKSRRKVEEAKNLRAKAEEAQKKAEEEATARELSMKEASQLMNKLDCTKIKLKEQHAEKHRLFTHLKKLLARKETH